MIQLLLNQFLQIYGPQRQNNPSINLQNVQSNQKKEDIKNTLNKKSNNQETDSLNLSGQSSIYNESNSKINELIKINKLLSLVIFISNESNEIQISTLSELVKSNKELKKSNEVQQGLLLELIKANNEQQKHNRILEKWICSNQNNSNINSPMTYYNWP